MNLGEHELYWCGGKWQLKYSATRGCRCTEGTSITVIALAGTGGVLIQRTPHAIGATALTAAVVPIITRGVVNEMVLSAEVLPLCSAH